MCDFVSWKEYNGKLYYLDNDKLNTKEGRNLVKYMKDNNSLDDLKGHGAIERYYPELKGKNVVNKEITNFYSPDNFPKEIVKKIKQGKMSEIIFSDFPMGLLNIKGVEKYNKIEQSALAEYNKIEQPALAEYNKIEQSAFWNIFKNKKYRNIKWI